MPEGVTALERSIVMVAARRMSNEGYVYMAVAGQREMEDRENIRYLPLYAEQLPSFGLMTTVVVLHHYELAARALDSYPGAQVFLLNPRVTEATQEEAANGSLSASQYFAHLRPWLVTGQMVSTRPPVRPTVISIPAALRTETTSW